MNNYIKEYKKTRKWTEYVHEKLKSGDFFNDQKIMDLLMDDSNLHEDAYNYSKIRIGDKYQCFVPEYQNKNNGYKNNYNLRHRNLNK